MYGLIHVDRESTPVTQSCRVLCASRSGDYRCPDRDLSAQSLDDGGFGQRSFYPAVGATVRLGFAARSHAAAADRARSASLVLWGWEPILQASFARHTKRIAPNRHFPRSE